MKKKKPDASPSCEDRNPLKNLIDEATAYANQHPHSWEFASQEDIQALSELFKKSPPIQSKIKPSAPLNPPKPTPPPIPNKPKEDLHKIPEAIDPPVPSLKTVESVKPKSDAEEKPSEEIIKILKKIAPQIKISSPPSSPPPSLKKPEPGSTPSEVKVKNVLLLLLDPVPETLELMKNLAKAIQKDLALPKLLSPQKIEQENGWNLFFQTTSYDLIITSLGGENYPNFSSYCQRKNITPIVLKQASVYNSSPSEKGHLWKTLCQILKT